MVGSPASGNNPSRTHKPASTPWAGPKQVQDDMPEIYAWSSANGPLDYHSIPLVEEAPRNCRSPSTSISKASTLNNSESPSQESVRGRGSQQQRLKRVPVQDVSWKGPRRHVRKLCNILRPWWGEIFWSFASVLLVLAIVALLYWAERKPLPRWPLGFTLNTAVALLATLCRACSVVPVGEALAQMKWNWFAEGKPRPLRDLGIVDKASRGPWGGIVMAFSVRMRFLGLSAAVILIAGLATSTVTQSAIMLAPGRHLVIHDDDDIFEITRRCPSLTKNYNMTSGLNIRDYDEAGLYRGFYREVFQHYNERTKPLRPGCGGQLCEFPVFSSLGLCMSLRNVTSQLVVSSDEERFWNASLLDGDARLVLDTGRQCFGCWAGMHEALQVTAPRRGAEDSSAPAWRYVAPEHVGKFNDTALTQLLFIYTNPFVYNVNRAKSFRALEVFLNVCVKTYRITNSGPDSDNTEVIAASHEVANNHTLPGLIHILPPEDHRGGDEQQEYSVRKDLLDQFNRRMHGELTGMWTRDATDTGPEVNSGLLLQEMAEKIFSGIVYPITAEEADKLMYGQTKEMMNDVAEGITNFMRGRPESEVVTGSAYMGILRVAIRWEGIAFLVVHTGLAILFLIAVIVHTARLGVDVVKISNTASLFAITAGSKLEVQWTPDGRWLTSDGIKPLLDGKDPVENRSLVGKLRKGEDGQGWRMEVEWAEKGPKETWPARLRKRLRRDKSRGVSSG